MAINWFPGHMAKTRREIKENLKFVDVVIELRDARIVKSSANPDVDEICEDKPRIILLNKCDLAEDKITNEWIKILSTESVKAIAVNSLNGNGLNNIKSLINGLLKEKHERQKNKGIVNIITRAMIVGIPNVGKSSFINKMSKSSIAKTGDRPGVTKSRQWIKTNLGFELMDTPGILWPKFEEKAALNLAFTGAIKDEIMDVEELAVKLIEVLIKEYADRLENRYKLQKIEGSPLEVLETIARKRGCIVSGGNIDYNRIAVLILDEFRGGKLGCISLERPESLESF